MLKKSSLKKRPLIALGILLLFIIVAYSTIYYYRDLVFGPPVLFWEDDYIQVNLYPSQYKSAVVFTVDDVTKLTDPKKVIAIADVLEKYGFKGVFFVIPQYKGRYRLTTDDSITQALLKISDGGHEIAQHGLTHSLPRKKPKIVNQAREFTDLPYGEQKRRVFVGKKILEEAGFMINGFRAPAFSADYNTLDVLEHLDFLYGSNAGLYPPPYMLANKFFVESIYYPYHPSNLNLLEFVSHGDLLRGHFNPKNFILIKHRFEKVYSRNGIFVIYSHIEPLNTPQALKLLEKSMEYINSRNVWKPSLTELALWWKAREALYATTELSADKIVITLAKGNELELADLSIAFKKKLTASEYVILSEDGIVLKEGKTKEQIVTIDY